MLRSKVGVGQAHATDSSKAIQQLRTGGPEGREDGWGCRDRTSCGFSYIKASILPHAELYHVCSFLDIRDLVFWQKKGWGKRGVDEVQQEHPGFRNLKY